LAGTDLVLPAVTQLPGRFATSEANAQLVLAAYVGGSGFGLLPVGCALSPSIGVLIALRFVQGGR
jgi:hypothetical protein